MNNNQVLVEEVQLKNVNLKDLWPNSKHTQELKTLVKKYDSNIDAVDIRPLLIPFSWELLDKYPKLGTITLQKYLSHLNDFFHGIGVLYDTIVIKEVNKLKDNKYYKKILVHYAIIKDEFFTLQKKNNLQKKIILYYDKEDLLEEVNHLISLIMEWYIVLLSLNSSKNTIIHSGLAHTTRLNNILQNFYDFKIVDKKGLNYMKHLNYDKVYSACVMIPDHVKNRFNKKIGFF